MPSFRWSARRPRLPTEIAGIQCEAVQDNNVHGRVSAPGEGGGFEEALQFAPAGRVAEFAQGLGLDLADALARDFVLVADLLQRAREAVVEAIAEFQDPALALRQAIKHFAELAFEQMKAGDLARVLGGLVFDQVAEMRLIGVAHGGLHGDGLLRHLQDRPHAFDGHLQGVGEFFGGGLVPQFLHELLLGAPELVDDLDHVDRDANGAGLVGDAAGDGLANPPGGVGGELVAALILELLDAFHQAHIAFLDQVEEGLAAIGVFLGDGDDEAQIGLDHLGLGFMGAGHGVVQLRASLEIIGMRRAHKPFEGPELVFLGLDDRLLGGGFALRFQPRDRPQPGLNLVADVLGHQRHLVNDPLLVTEAREEGLELPIEPLELVEQARAPAFPRRLLPGGKLVVGLPVQGADALDEPAQELEMAGAAGDELVDDGPVKPLLGRHGEQLVRQRQVLFGGKPEAVHDPARLLFRRFNALANLHLLLPGQQRHLAHLAQIHPHRIIQNIVAALFLLLVGLDRTVPLHFGGVNDLDLQAAQLGEDMVQIGRGGKVVRQGVVQVVIGQVPLLLGEAQEVFDLLRQVETRLVLDQIGRLRGAGW